LSRGRAPGADSSLDMPGFAGYRHGRGHKAGMTADARRIRVKAAARAKPRAGHWQEIRQA